MTPTCRLLVPSLVLACLAGACPSLAAAEVPRVIFDSDMSSDHDDVGDIAVLHGLASMGECTIIGMMVSSLNGGTALCMDAINTWYGKPGIPIGVPPNIGGVGGYPGQIAAEYPHALKSAAECPHAADLYRKLLAASPDRSVTIVTTGFLTNLKALLLSPADQYSPLDGKALVRQKVKLWACAGGAFPRGNEFNFRSSGDDSAFVVINGWPAAVTYVGFDVGQVIHTCGPLVDAPEKNPIRRVYVDIKKHYPYPSWGQIMIYDAIRPGEGLWGAVSKGHNNADQPGSNWWSTDADPNGDQEQSYLLEKVRSPVRAGIDALIMLPPNDGTPSRPGQPTDIRATIIGGNRIDLVWTDNAYNEDGFEIERRVDGVYKPVATTAANTAHWSDTGLAATANTAYRVRAKNAVGTSAWSYAWIYSGWTEIDLAKPGDLPLYSYYQYSSLRWARGGDFRPDHVVLNDDSLHGRDVAIDVDVGALGAEGKFHVYLLWQDADNWYRLSTDRAGSCFEKRIAGKTSQVGAGGPGVDIGNGSDLSAWQVASTAAGRLTFAANGTTLVDVTEPLALDGGRIGLGGNARTPVWENFRFATAPAR